MWIHSSQSSWVIKILMLSDLSCVYSVQRKWFLFFWKNQSCSLLGKMGVRTLTYPPSFYANFITEKLLRFYWTLFLSEKLWGCLNDLSNVLQPLKCRCWEEIMVGAWTLASSNHCLCVQLSHQKMEIIVKSQSKDTKANWGSLWVLTNYWLPSFMEYLDTWISILLFQYYYTLDTLLNLILHTSVLQGR